MAMFLFFVFWGPRRQFNPEKGASRISIDKSGFENLTTIFSQGGTSNSQDFTPKLDPQKFGHAALRIKFLFVMTRHKQFSSSENQTMSRPFDLSHATTFCVPERGGAGRSVTKRRPQTMHATQILPQTTLHAHARRTFCTSVC